MDNAVLRITDGIDYVDLVGQNSAFQVKEWNPVMANPKGGGVWSDQPFLHGRQLVHRVYENVIDNFTLVVRSGNMDLTIAETRKARQLLQKASDYWTVEWATEPVWLEARGSNETNIRYTVIKDWRAPGDDNPFGTPFFACPSMMDEFSLLIEHDFWMALPPGTGECVEISNGEISLGYLEFDGVDDNVNCGSDAALDDLPAVAGGFTAEAWVRFDSDLGNEVIMGKGYWYLRASYSPGAYMYIHAYILAGTPAQSQGLWFTFPDNEWHHVVMTYDDGGTRLIRLWLDGVEAPSYAQTAAVGALTSDAALSFKIGANAPGDALWKSGIGWVRLTSSILYTTTFIPLDRCIIPGSVGATTVAIWITEGIGTTTYNKIGTPNTNGTITGALWATDCHVAAAGVCSEIGDNEAIFVSNQRGGQLTHVFYYDASTTIYSANLMGKALPQALLPNPFAVGDIIYFGSDTQTNVGGSFNNVVFDLHTPAATITSGVWEYWDAGGGGGGSWVAIPSIASVRGNLLFGLTGVDAVYFSPPGAWVITSIQGCFGYMIRYRVTGIGGAATPPIQQLRNVYSAMPYVMADSESVRGDFSALAEAYLYEKTADKSKRAMLAVRSTQRGADFSAYINMADACNPIGVTVAAAGVSAFGTDPRAPAGRYLWYNPAAGPAAWSTEAVITFTYPMTLEYSGRFRLILRAYQSGGAVDDFYFRTYTQIGTASIGYGKTKASKLTGGDLPFGMLSPGLIDLGEIELSISDDIGFETVSIGIQVQNNAVAPGDIFFIDAWFIPVDESAVEAIGLKNAEADSTNHTIITSLAPKRQPTKAYIARNATDIKINDWKTIASTALQLPRETQFKLWSFLANYDTGPVVFYSYTSLLNTLYLQKNERYFSMRGNT